MSIQLIPGSFHEFLVSRDLIVPKNVVLAGTATVWDDLVMPLLAGKQGQTDKPVWDATNGGYLYPQNDTSHILYLNAQLPHRWKFGSAVFPHLHWHQAVNQTPVFKMDYRWSEIGGAVPAGWTTYTMSSKVATYTSGTIHQISYGAALSGTGYTMSSILQIKLYRDDNAYTGNLLATSFDIHYESDTLGSNAEYVK
jgi:hypothetical protein